jgi:16S rRNA (cytidine1402-2'-O)-methyltransferase
MPNINVRQLAFRPFGRSPLLAMSGVLRVVATPLGNLDDLSKRAREALSTADALIAEDTRRTGRLLLLAGLPKKPIFSYFAPQERTKVGPILKRLREGKTLALVTDGGTPGISDPGAILVGLAHEAGIRIEPIPGPSAVAMALSVSSLSGERFVFEGFLPPKAVARRARLEALAKEERTIVLYEAPHRLSAMLVDLVETFGGNRKGTIVREGTKLHEEIREGTLAELASAFAEDVRGEVVLVVEGSPVSSDSVRVELDALLAFLVESGLSPDRAARVVATWTGLPRGRLTRMAKALS